MQEGWLFGSNGLHSALADLFNSLFPKKSKKETRVPIVLTKPSGGSRGAPPLFLYQTEDRRAEKIAFENEPPSLISGSGWPPPAPTFPYLKVWIHHWHHSLPRSRFYYRHTTLKTAAREQPGAGIVSSRNAPSQPFLALRDDTKNGCEGDYWHHSLPADVLLGSFVYVTNEPQRTSAGRLPSPLNLVEKRIMSCGF